VLLVGCFQGLLLAAFLLSYHISCGFVVLMMKPSFLGRKIWNFQVLKIRNSGDSGDAPENCPQKEKDRKIQNF
jgi:hypothetical protein